MMTRFFLTVAVVFAVVACNRQTSPQPGDEPLVAVFDSRLMRSEVVAFVPAGTPKDDSILMAQNYIHNWITNRLLLQKAFENLTDEEKNIQRQVENYRTSLLIHQYKQKLIAQKLSEEVTDEEVDAYYNDNKVNFELSTPIIKGVYVVIPKSASNINDVRKWCKSDDVDDMERLEDYCLANARKFDDFEEKWIELKFVSNLLPDGASTLETEVKNKRFIEKEDENNFYFLKINELCPELAIAPIGYVRDEIVLILKNRRKMKFEDELDRQINEEAVRKNYVKMY